MSGISNTTESVTKTISAEVPSPLWRAFRLQIFEAQESGRKGVGWNSIVTSALEQLLAAKTDEPESTTPVPPMSVVVQAPKGLLEELDSELASGLRRLFDGFTKGKEQILASLRKAVAKYDEAHPPTPPKTEKEDLDAFVASLP